MGVLGVFSGVLMFSRCSGMFSGCLWVSSSVCGVFSGVV